jgi:hypothetical protein
MGNLKYHTNIIHLNLGKKIKYSCPHGNCKSNFKTLRQKALHHEKSELECKTENTLLIHLINKTRKIYKSFTNKFNKKFESKIEIKRDDALNDYFNELSNNFLETGREYFSSMMNDDKYNFNCPLPLKACSNIE